jgi:hypothetical protein
MKYSLDDEVEYDFKLIGISCHEKDYRLCWGINSVMDFTLERTEKELQTFPSKKNPQVSTHTLFSAFDEDSENEFHLIVNRTSMGYLIPEKPQADYLFLIKEEKISLPLFSSTFTFIIIIFITPQLLSRFAAIIIIIIMIIIIIIIIVIILTFTATTNLAFVCFLICVVIFMF